MQLKVKNPGKQRKRLFNAPAHIRHKLMAAPLSKELAEKQGVKTLPVRKGDTVHIQRGDNKGFEGKISRVDLKSYRIYIEGLTREKVDGTNIFTPVHPSKVMIRNLNLDDKRRKAVIERKKPLEKTAIQAKPKKATPVRIAKPKLVLPPVEEVEVKPKLKPAPVKPKAAPEVVKEEAPAKKVETPKAVEKEEAPKKPAPKAETKKPAAKAAPAKKAEAKVEEPKEEAPAKKTAKPKAAKKAPAKETPEKETASKSRAKPKTSKKTEGGQ